MSGLAKFSSWCIILRVTGHGPVWLGRYNGVVEVDGSNPSAPTESNKLV